MLQFVHIRVLPSLTCLSRPIALFFKLGFVLTKFELQSLDFFTVRRLSSDRETSFQNFHRNLDIERSIGILWKVEGEKLAAKLDSFVETPELSSAPVLT
jgi:hypothetical protein